MYSKNFLEVDQTSQAQISSNKIDLCECQITIEDRVPSMKSRSTSVRHTLIIFPMLFERGLTSKVWFIDLLPTCITLHISSYGRL